MDKRGRIDGKIVDIVEFDDLFTRQDVRNNYTAVEVPERGIALPVRSKTDNRPGVYINPVYTRFVYPEDSELSRYKMTNENVIDLNNTKDMSELIKKNNCIKEMEATNLIASEGKITFIPPNNNDTAEMTILKQAINLKRIDLDKYEDRFNGNYNNDKRLFFKNSISFPKFKSSAEALDMKVTVIIEDKDGDIPNPIGKRLVAEITGGNWDDESE